MFRPLVQKTFRHRAPVRSVGDQDASDGISCPRIEPREDEPKHGVVHATGWYSDVASVRKRHRVRRLDDGQSWSCVATPVSYRLTLNRYGAARVLAGSTGLRRVARDSRGIGREVGS